MGRPKGSRNTTSISQVGIAELRAEKASQKVGRPIDTGKGKRLKSTAHRDGKQYTSPNATDGVSVERMNEIMDEIQAETGNRPACANTTLVKQKVLVDKISATEQRPMPSRGMYAGEAKPQDHLDAINHTLSKPLRGKPWAYPTIEGLRSEILEYFEFMVGRRIPLTVAGLCAWLGISTGTARYWKTHEHLLPWYSEMETAMAYIQSMQEAGAVEGRVVPYTYQFLAKNYHGMRDVREIEVSGESGILDASDQKAIIDNIPDVADDD